jgi:hypothetical protein
MYNIGMPLDALAKRYAEMLFQEQAEKIREDQNKEMQKVTADYSRRNMLQSGMYLSAKGKVIGDHLGMMAEARANALVQAYERSRLAFDASAVHEVSAAVDQFCEAQKAPIVAAARHMVGQTFGPQGIPQNLSETITKQMEHVLSGAASRIKRSLSIKHAPFPRQRRQR